MSASRGLACFVALVATFAMIISAVNTYYIKMTEIKCDAEAPNRDMNYTVIALAGALMIIMWVMFGLTWSKTADKGTVNAFLVIAWLISVAGLVISCLHEPYMRQFHQSCKDVSGVSTNYLANTRWIAYSLITVFGVSTIVLMAWVYMHNRSGGSMTTSTTARVVKERQDEELRRRAGERQDKKESGTKSKGSSDADATSDLSGSG